VIEANSSSAASEIADRLPDDACADEPGDNPREEAGDEFDSLPDPSSAGCAGKDAERPVSPSRFTRFKSARMSEAFW
jgi:hypothetical protein